MFEIFHQISPGFLQEEQEIKALGRKAPAIKQTSPLSIYPEILDTRYKSFNWDIVENEVLIFLSSLVHLLKPTKILETGTCYGFSAAIMAHAMSINKIIGKITTLEYNEVNWLKANALFEILQLTPFISSLNLSSLNFDPGPEIYDFIFLDTEPFIRFQELVKFYKNLKDGGLFIIHDLPQDLGHTGQHINGVLDFQWGDFRSLIGPFFRNHDLVPITFGTARGLVLLQKRSYQQGYTKFMKGLIS